MLIGFPIFYVCRVLRFALSFTGKTNCANKNSTGTSCVIQNCVLSDRVVIEPNCNMNECSVGTGYRVPAGTKAKVDSFSARSAGF
jgi:hypothetical protein